MKKWLIHSLKWNLIIFKGASVAVCHTDNGDSFVRLMMSALMLINQVIVFSLFHFFLGKLVPRDGGGRS
jgi:hypothetical protein